MLGLQTLGKVNHLTAFLHTSRELFQGFRSPASAFPIMDYTAARSVPPVSTSFGGRKKASQNVGSNARGRFGSHDATGSFMFGSFDSNFPPASTVQSGAQLPDPEANNSCDSPVVEESMEVRRGELSHGERDPRSTMRTNVSVKSPFPSASQAQDSNRPASFETRSQRRDLQNANPTIGLESREASFQQSQQYEDDFPVLGAAFGAGLGGRPQRKGRPQRESEVSPSSHREEQLTASTPDEARVHASSVRPRFDAETQAFHNSGDSRRENRTYRQRNERQDRSQHDNEADLDAFGRMLGDSRRENRTYRQRNERQNRSQHDNEADLDAFGRMLTQILRHRAVDYKLKIRSDGFVEVRDILNLTMKTATRRPINSHTTEDVIWVVEQDKKQRYGIRNEEGTLLIRANQGHTLEGVATEDLLRPITSPGEAPVCVHGTFMRHKNVILKEGLKRMTRRHVHFATGEYGTKDVISGMRRTCEVLIYLNVEQALSDGMKLYISENKVILTEGFDGVVPVKYFTKVVNIKSGKIIYPET